MWREEEHWDEMLMRRCLSRGWMFRGRRPVEVSHQEPNPDLSLSCLSPRRDLVSTMKTYRKYQPPLLPRIPEPPIEHHTFRAQILRSRTHQPTPTRWIHIFRLRHKHHCVFRDGVYEVFGGLRRGLVVLRDHFDGVGWAEDFGWGGTGCVWVEWVHFHAWEMSAVEDAEFDEGIADFWDLVSLGFSVLDLLRGEYR